MSATASGADGGEAVYGWCLWLFPGVWVEAEFHTVWRSSDDELIDVTPKVGGEKAIMFVIDPTRPPSTRQSTCLLGLGVDG